MAQTIPDAALDKHVALLGMTGAGKSSVIKTAIVEPDLEAGRRVGIITPKDDWWGLRLSKNGKSKGYDIPIFGGYHADYPLNVKDAALLAEVYGTMRGSAIFCTAKLSVQDRARWFAAFAEALLNKNKGWMRLVIDEAHIFMPKQGGQGGGNIPAALHAGNELVSQGRSQGLRIVLASQRSAKLHNDSLTQCHCLLAMTLMAPHDRKAVKDWIEDQADPEKGKEVISSLSSMKPGQAWVWAPLAKVLEKIQFARPKTFDSSAAPDDDEGVGPTLPAVNLDALQGKLAKVEAEKKSKDPVLLAAEVARLTAELARRPTAAPSDPAIDAKALAAAGQEAWVDGRKTGIIEGLHQAEQTLKSSAAVLAKFTQQARDLFDGLGRAVVDISAQVTAIQTNQSDLKKSKNPTGPSTPSRSEAPARTVPRAPPSKPSPGTGGDGTLSSPLLNTLNAVRWWYALGFSPIERRRACLVAGLSPKASTFGVYVGQLIREGYLETSKDGLSLTAHGMDASTPPDGIQNASGLRQEVRKQLTAPELKVFDAIYDAYPNPIARGDLADAVGLSRTASTLGVYIGAASAIGLVENAGSGMVKAADWLFP